MRLGIATVVAVALTTAACVKPDGNGAAVRPPADQTSDKPSDQSKPPQAELKTVAEQEGFGDFVQRVNAYVDLHKRLEATLPKLPQEASPEAIDKYQRALAALIRKERTGARRGDIFVPAAQKAIKAVLARVFGAPDGKQLKASIMDENPVDAPISINGRYPSTVPLSTVPPQVLASLPKLPPEIEYRFVGDRLILLDTHAYLIVDYIDNALP